MICKMKKYTFLVYHKEYENFLIKLREIGVMHVSEKAEGYVDDPELSNMMARCSEIQRLLEKRATDKLLADREALIKKLSEAQGEERELSVWGDFSSIQVEKLRNAGYTLRYHVCPAKKFQETWGIPVAISKGNTYFVSVQGFGIDEIEFDPLLVRTEDVACSVTEKRKEIEQLKVALADVDAQIAVWQKENISKLEIELETIRRKIDWQRVMLSTDSVAGDSLRLMVGYCPLENCQTLNEILEKQHVWYQQTDAEDGDLNAPAKLKNNRFARLFESLTGMYGWPTYGEFDPTPLLAPFFLLFFAMCMGDAGYGIVLIIFGLLLKKGTIEVDMFKGMGPIITVLGVGTLVVGLVLGTFFGMPLYEQSWVPEAIKPYIIQGDVQLPNGSSFALQMLLAVGIGVFHICFAMIVKCLCMTKRFGWKDAISQWSWTLLIVGCVVTLSVSAIISLDMELVKFVLIGIGVVSALGIYLLNKPGRNPLINIGMGLLDTYSMASGLLGDVLSYLRLYALGLAGGALGNTFNDLAMMCLGDEPSLVWIVALPGCILIILLGHTLNVGMSCLGAFVHPLRLTFVEYFKNSGYEGKGVLYKPFK